MQEKFDLYRKQYPIFRYKSYNIDETVDEIILTYNFEIDNLTKFSPYIKILKKQFKFNEINNTFFNKLAFNIGLIELVSYWKATCSPKVIIECGVLDGWQISWFKKLYFNGLGEFFYVNNIKTNINDFMEISSEGDKSEASSEDKINLKPINNSVLIPIGGGKDSCVTMELLKNVDNKYCIMVNPKKVSLECANIAEFTNERIIEVYRKIDNNLIDLNTQGFLNGHTPFSSLLAFITYTVSYLLDIKHIALSNESSANESNVVGKNINHQYSKSFEFENDFREYCKKYLNSEIEYFSFLRSLNELQIAKLFSKYEKYHKVFRSCNVGSKNSDWKWCCNCPKCLFVFIILSPFLYKRSEFSKEKLLNIFGEDLFEKKELLETFLQLTGYADVKPFECVGTFEEVNYAVSRIISELRNKNEKLPFLLDYYYSNYKLFDISNDLTREYNKKNNIPTSLEKFIKNA